MTFNEFIEKYSGKKIDYDGKYSGQCVDLYRQYVKEVLGFVQSPPVVGAAEIFETASPDLYEKIKNSPEGVPQKGDIVIWNKRAGGGFGHVAIFISGNIHGFLSFDQNWRALNVCETTAHVYTNVTGWLRPRVTSDQVHTDQEWQEERDERNKNWELYQSQLGVNKELKNESELIRKQLEKEKEDQSVFLESVAKILNLKHEQDPQLYKATIVPAIETAITFEDKAKKLQVLLDEEREEYERKLKELQSKFDTLENDFVSLKTQLEKLQEQKPEPVVIEEQSKSRLQIFIEWLFRR